MKIFAGMTAQSRRRKALTMLVFLSMTKVVPLGRFVFLTKVAPMGRFLTVRIRMFTRLVPMSRYWTVCTFTRMAAWRLIAVEAELVSCRSVRPVVLLGLIYTVERFFLPLKKRSLLVPSRSSRSQYLCHWRCCCLPWLSLMRFGHSWCSCAGWLFHVCASVLAGSWPFWAR